MMRHLPNLITALRIVLVFPLCWMILHGRYDSALVIAVVAGVSDALDGYLARRFSWRSRIGGMLDPIADKVMLTTAFVSLALVAAVPVWLAVLILGRDLVIVVGAIAYVLVIGRFDAAPTTLSKLTTVVQILFVLIVLLHLSQWLTLSAGVERTLVTITAAITLASGLHYVWIWGRRARSSLLTSRAEKTQ